MLTLIGFEDATFTAKNGDKVFGTRLHFTYEKDKAEGLCTETVYCSEKVDLDGLSLGDICEISYNKFGKVAKVIKVQ